MSNALRSRIPLFFVLAVALALRLYVWHRTTVYMYHDELLYDQMARHVVLDGYLGQGSAPDAFVTPLYPLFVALMYKLSMILHGQLLPQTRLIHEVFLAQQVLSLLGIVAAYEVARLLANKWAGLAAAVLSLVYLPNGFVGVMLLTEALFIPLLLCTLWAYVYAQRAGRTWAYGLTGALLGLTTLTRPTVLPLFAVFVFCDWLLRSAAPAGGWRRFIPARAFWFDNAVQLACLIVVMAPWWIRNAIDFHRFIPLDTEAGNPLLAGVSPYGRVSITTLIAMSRALHESQQTFAIHYMLSGFTHHFFLYAGWFLFGKLGPLLWLPYVYQYIPAFVLFHRVLLFAGALAMFIALGSRRARGVSLSVLVMLAIQLVFLPIARYGYPVVVVWMILIPVVAAWLWSRLRGDPAVAGNRA